MESISNYLDSIEDILEGSSKVPFSNKVSIDREELYAILDDIRMNMPIELEKAQKIVSEHDRIIGDAEAKASSILGAAKVQAEQLMEEHEIYQQASEAGNEIIERSKKNAKEFRVNATEYADEILNMAETSLRESIEILNENQHLINQRIGEMLEDVIANRSQVQGSSQNYQ